MFYRMLCAAHRITRSTELEHVSLADYCPGFFELYLNQVLKLHTVINLSSKLISYNETGKQKPWGNWVVINSFCSSFTDNIRILNLF